MRIPPQSVQLGPLRLTLLQFLALFALPCSVFALIFHAIYIIPLGIVLCFAAWAIFHLIHKTQYINRKFDYIDTYVFPKRIHQTLTAKHPHLTTKQIDLVIEGLRHFFKMNAINQSVTIGEMVAMPSQVIDDAWHEFILFTRNYEQFSKQAFGKFLHHTPAEAMPSTVSATQSLKTAWATACIVERMDPADLTAYRWSSTSTVGLTSKTAFTMSSTAQKRSYQEKPRFARHISAPVVDVPVVDVVETATVPGRTAALVAGVVAVAAAVEEDDVSA